MTFITLVFRLLLAVLLLSGCTARLREGPEEISAPQGESEIMSYRPPAPQVFSLANGMTVYLLENTELPLVEGSLLIPGGSLWTDANEKGAASAMGSLMRTGGAGKRGPGELDRELEKLAASVDSSMGPENGAISFSCLSDDLDAVFGIFSDVVLHPRFDAGRLELMKMRSMEEIRRRADNPSAIAGISFRQLMYGDTPYGYVAGSADVARMNPRVVKKLFERFIRPQGAILAVSGNVNRPRLESLASRYFGSWENGGGSVSLEAPPVNSDPGPAIYFIDKPFQQATVYMGELGVPRFTPDWYDILIFNEVFGSGGHFGSRLMKEIRSDAGLVYSINGGVNPALSRGLNYIAFQTKAESTGDAVVRSLEVLRRMQAQPLSEEELRHASSSLVNSFIFKFDAPSDVVQRKAMQQIMHFPPDYDDTYIERIKGVTPASVQQVARQRWHPERFVIVVVGDSRAYSSLARLSGEGEPLRGYPIKRADFGEELKLD